MITGKTKSGFKYEISENALDDFRLFRLIAKADKDASKIIDVIDRLLGEEQAERLEEHLAREDGTVPNEAIGEELKEILESQTETKNSSSLPE